MFRIDDLLHPDLTLFVEAQPLVDEMEQRPFKYRENELLFDEDVSGDSR